MVLSMRDFDLNLLRVFDALMRHRGVTAAAAELGLTQSSTSNALDRLRKALSDRILERQGNHMVPTRLALALWPAIAAALDQIDGVFASVSAFDPATASGTFRIGLDAYAMALAAVPLAGIIGRSAPAMRLEILPVAHPEEEQALSLGAIDLFIGSVWQPVPGVLLKTLFVEDFVALVAPGHPLTEAPADLDTFLAHAHILTSPRGSVAGNVDAALALIGRQRRISLTTPNFESSAEAAREGLGIFTCGRRLAEIYAEKLGLVALPLPLEIPGFSVKMEWVRRNDRASDLSWLRDRAAEFLR